MGGCQSDMIKDFAIEITKEFAGKSVIGKLISIMSASRNCQEKVSSCEDLGPFMKCKFLEAQKDPYDFMAILVVSEILLITILSVVLYKKTKKVVVRFVNRNSNVAMITQQPARRTTEPRSMRQNTNEENWL